MKAISFREQRNNLIKFVKQRSFACFKKKTLPENTLAKWIRFDADLVNEEFVSAVKGEGLSFNVWTLDELPLVLRAFAVGADTVTTNCAKQMFDEYCALYAPEMQSHSEFEERMPDGAAFPSAQVHGF